MNFGGFIISLSITANLVWREMGDFEGWDWGGTVVGRWCGVGDGGWVVWGSGRRLPPRRRKGGAGGMGAACGGLRETGSAGKMGKVQ